MLIKDLSKVKDEEITLQDVKRAEEIIARANKLLGRAAVKEIHHWNGWGYWNVPTFQPYYYTTTGGSLTFCGTAGNATTTNAFDLNTSVTDAVAQITR